MESDIAKAPPTGGDDVTENQEGGPVTGSSTGPETTMTTDVRPSFHDSPPLPTS